MSKTVSLPKGKVAGAKARSAAPGRPQGAAVDDVPSGTPMTRAPGGERRRAVALAARALIAERGLEGLRTRDVAERVGINIATLHYHVPTKEALLQLVAQSAKEDFIARDMARSSDARTPRQQLRREIDDYRALIHDNPTLLMVLSEFAERARRDPVVARILVDLQKPWRDSLAAILARGVADGSFRGDLDPNAGATLIATVLGGAWRQSRIQPVDLSPICDELERCFLNSRA